MDEKAEKERALNNLDYFRAKFYGMRASSKHTKTNFEKNLAEFLALQYAIGDIEDEDIANIQKFYMNDLRAYEPEGNMQKIDDTLYSLTTSEKLELWERYLEDKEVLYKGNTIAGVSKFLIAPYNNQSLSYTVWVWAKDPEHAYQRAIKQGIFPIGADQPKRVDVVIIKIGDREAEYHGYNTELIDPEWLIYETAKILTV